jgi:uncharacterized low-complexity protein
MRGGKKWEGAAGTGRLKSRIRRKGRRNSRGLDAWVMCAKGGEEGDYLPPSTVYITLFLCPLDEPSRPIFRLSSSNPIFHALNTIPDEINATMASRNAEGKCGMCARMGGGQAAEKPLEGVGGASIRPFPLRRKGNAPKAVGERAVWGQAKCQPLCRAMAQKEIERREFGRVSGSQK